MSNEVAGASTKNANAQVGGERVLTREELYALVWETPLSRLSNTSPL